jgi:prephenate dehydratase
MTAAARRTRYAYLGPAGTFTETALLQLPGAAGARLLPLPSVDAALDAVRAGEADAAMLPIENSVEGGVTATLDALAQGELLLVVAEQVVPVTFQLVARPGLSLEDVTRVATHPQGLAQCRGWLHANLPKVALVPALSTAAAAAGLLEPDCGYDAALCAPIAAARYGLPVLVENVGDNPNAVTRFVLVSRPGPMPAPTGADKSTLVAYLSDDHPGALLELLEQFAVRGVNLTRLESRPTGELLGRYCMSIDADGHVAEERMAEALKGLHRVCSAVRFLGSYPRADGERTSVRPETADGAFAAADEWLASVRNGNL